MVARPRLFLKILLASVSSKCLFLTRTGMNIKRHSESFGNCGTILDSFSANGFVVPLFIRHCPKSIGGAKDKTKNTDAAMLYKNVLTIQNPPDLEWPATNPANAGVRDEFLLGIFPPDHGGNHVPLIPTPLVTSAK